MRGFLREVVFLGVLVLAVLSARSSFADHYYVPSGSMLPTVEVGDHLIVNKLAYGFRVPFTDYYLVDFDGPHRGDVVVLESPADGTTLLKRVAAVPGDEVQVRRGQLILNGKTVPVEGDPGALIEDLGDHRHSVRLTQGGGPDFGPIRLPEGKYLVLGDNRGESLDGRAFGLVDHDRILGRAIAIYWRHGLVWDSFDRPQH